jgi:hypothetical protein
MSTTRTSPVFGVSTFRLVPERTGDRDFAGDEVEIAVFMQADLQRQALAESHAHAGEREQEGIPPPLASLRSGQKGRELRPCHRLRTDG